VKEIIMNMILQDFGKDDVKEGLEVNSNTSPFENDTDLSIRLPASKLNT
jgi:hypothetical protein